MTLLKKMLRISVPVVVFFVIFRYTDLPKLLQTFLQLTPGWILLLMSVSVALVYLSAIKWGLFIEHFGERISAFRLTALYLLGYFVNLILPSYLGGDAVRSWQVGKKVGQHAAAAATILERYTGLVAMITLAVIFMWWSGLVTWQIKAAIILIALGLVVITCIGLNTRSTLLLNRLPYGGKVSKHFEKLQEAFRIVAEDPKLLLKTLCLSFVYHSVTVLNTLTCAYAIGWFNPPIGELFVVLPLILLIGAIPISPNGLGIQDGAFFYFLRGLGATSEQALGIALILRAKSYVLALCGGIVWWYMKGDATRAPAPLPEQIH